MKETRTQWVWLTIKRRLQYSIWHKGQWESSLCVQYQTLHDYWFLIPCQPQWLNRTSETSSGTSTGREVIPMFFPLLKISPFILCWIQLGALFGRLTTSAFHIYVVAMGSGGRVCFGPCAMRKFCDFSSGTTMHQKKKSQPISVIG